MPYLVLIILSLCASLWADDNRTTIVAMPVLPAGYKTLRVDTLSQCLLRLPSEDSLQAKSEGHDEYLKRILGGKDNRHVKVWQAQVRLSYTVRYQLLYVLIPEGGLEKQEPIFKEVVAEHMAGETLSSSSGDSDFFAFSSPRRYYFDSEAKASQSALKQARQRLSELRPLQCQAK